MDEAHFARALSYTPFFLLLGIFCTKRPWSRSRIYVEKTPGRYRCRILASLIQNVRYNGYISKEIITVITYVRVYVSFLFSKHEFFSRVFLREWINIKMSILSFNCIGTSIPKAKALKKFQTNIHKRLSTFLNIISIKQVMLLC